MIRVENLVKEYRDSKKGVVRALGGISFEARPGEIFGLIGDNGAGKTTTLRILSTVLTATSGRVEIDGLDVITQADQVRSHFGFISGTTGLYGRLTPRETLNYFAGLYGLSPEAGKRRSEELIESLGISEFVDRQCDKLSTGQKQRVGIARTVLHDPPVLFLDEPTSGLDVASSQGIMEFIEKAKSEGKTVVFSSHHMAEVERLCDRLVVLHEGAIRGEGTVASIQADTGQTTLERAFLALVDYRSAGAA
ncbi:MAG: ABC transporter ATP-binding protein [Fimbriimonadaceae bacterium]